MRSRGLDNADNNIFSYFDLERLASKVQAICLRLTSTYTVNDKRIYECTHRHTVEEDANEQADDD